MIEARKEKTRTERSGMLSTRLRLLLEMRQHDPAGQPWPGEAYIFGDELGRVLALGYDPGSLDERSSRGSALRACNCATCGTKARISTKRPARPSPTCRNCSGTPASGTGISRNKRRRMAQLAVNRLNQARAEAAQAQALAAEVETTDDRPPDSPARSRSH